MTFLSITKLFLILFYSLFSLPFSNGDVYVNAFAAGGKNCGAATFECQTLGEALQAYGYASNRFIISQGNYSYQNDNINVTASQITAFTGESYSSVVINFTLDGIQNSFKTDYSAQLNFTRLTLVFSYPETLGRTLLSMGSVGNPMVTISQCRLTQAVDSLPFLRFLIQCESGKLVISRCILENFVFSSTGRLLEINAEGNVVLENSTFSNISKTSDNTINGLAVFYNGYQDSSGLIIQLCNFINITSKHRGGAIYATSRHILDVTNSVFNRCSTSGLGGGAIFLDVGTPYAIVGCSFQNNSGLSGGAVYIAGDNTGAHRFLMNDFRGNSVGGDGDGKGKDIFQAVTISYDDWFVDNFEHFKDNCGTCTENCFVSGTGEQTESISFSPADIYHGCARTVNVTGWNGDNSEVCAIPAAGADAGKCGTLAYIVKLNPQPSRISIGSFSTNPMLPSFMTTDFVVGVGVTKELQVIGLGQSVACVFVGPFTDVALQYGFAVSNGTELSLYQLTLKYKTQDSITSVLNPHFVDVRGAGSTVTISGCIVVGQDDQLQESVITSVLGAFSETFDGGTTRVVDTSAANISFTSTYGGLFRVSAGNLLLRALNASALTTTEGSGAVVHGFLDSGNWIVIDEATRFFNVTAPLGSGGALWLNLTVGSQVNLTSVIFVDCVAGGQGGAVYLRLPVLEVEKLSFADVRFRNNQIKATPSNIASNVHLAFPTRVAFPCFTLFDLRLVPHNLSLWNISDISDSSGRSLAALLAECGTDPCARVSPELCGTELSPICVPTPGPGGVLVGCETNDCVDRSGFPYSPPCSGRCIVSAANASQCVLDACEAYTAAECAEHADEGCAESQRHCVMKESVVNAVGSSTTSSTVDQISVATGLTATTGIIRVGPGRFVQTPFVLGRKTLVITGVGTGAAGSGSGTGTGVYTQLGAGEGDSTTVVAAGPYGGVAVTSPLISVAPGVSLDLVNLTLSILTADSSSPRAAAWSSSTPLILVTEARLALYDVAVSGLVLNDSVLLAERPVEFMAERVRFTDILFDWGLPGRSHGGAALALDFRGSRNSLGSISSCNFTNVSADFHNLMTLSLYGGAVWVQSSGIGHKMIVDDTVFLKCTCSLDGGAMQITSADNSLVAVLEDVEFRDCTARNGGGLMGAARPLHLHGCTFENCSARNLGGGYYQISTTIATDGDIYIVDCVFNKSSCGTLSRFGGGGCSLATTGAVFVHGTVFNQCSIQQSGTLIANGSALYIRGSLSVVITVTNFTDCLCEQPAAASSNQWGTLSVEGNANGQTLIDRCRFVNNRARNGGGALNLQTSNATIRLCVFEGNSATYPGGQGPIPGITYPAGCGGAVFVSGGTVLSYIGGNTFTQNTQAADGEGRDVYIAAMESTGSDTEVAKNCFSSGTASVAVEEGRGLNPFTPSECPATTEDSTAIVATVAQQVQSFLRYNIAQTLVVNLTTAATGAENAYALSSAFVLTENVTIQSGISSETSQPYILANNSMGNLFTVSTGTLTMRNLVVLVAQVLAQDSVIRSIEQGTIVLESVTFKRLPNPVRPFATATTTAAAAARDRTRSRSLGNQAINPWAFEGVLLTFEQGTMTITDSVFEDFVFQSNGHAIAITAEHHHSSALVVKNTNFTNIRSTYGQHVGVCIYAELRSADNTLTLENVVFDQTTTNSIGIIVPALSLLGNVLTIRGVLFPRASEEDVNAVEGTNVYIGTFLTLEENFADNDICTDKALFSQVDGFFGESNTGLCIGEAEVCGYATPIAVYREENCLPEEAPAAEAKDDSSNSKSKSKVSGGIIAAIVILAVVVVVVVVVAIVVVVYFRNKSEGFRKILDERESRGSSSGSGRSDMTKSSSTSSGSGYNSEGAKNSRVETTDATQAYESKEENKEEEGDVEEEVEDV